MVISIGEFIKFLRQRAKISQEELANALGCTVKGLSKIENGASMPRAYTVGLCEDYFKVKISRYYPNTGETVTLKAYDKSWEILRTLGLEDLTRAYNLACDFERSKLVKNSINYMDIYFAKARFYAGVANDPLKAIECCETGLKYEKYIIYSPDSNSKPLTIETLIPSMNLFNLTNFLSLCLSENGEKAKATAIWEEGLSALTKLFNETHLTSFCYDSYRLGRCYSAHCCTLADVYYEMGRFTEALGMATNGINLSEEFGSIAFLCDTIYIKFKALCKLKKYSEALSILPDMLFLYKESKNKEQYANLNSEFAQDFPEIETQINNVFSLYNTLRTMHVE
ncbi:MAG: helix-turn-helix domain-containing protein [Clostridiales bacterium]|jgi:transcriptional regulator with XRE-family HTH domain|nr:helix-turn-helix domain-containing protein [Clostridiales bacterium]